MRDIGRAVGVFVLLASLGACTGGAGGPAGKDGTRAYETRIDLSWVPRSLRLK